MIDKNILEELAGYIKEHLSKPDCMCEKTIMYKYSICRSAVKTELEEFIDANRKSKFNVVLFGFIDKKGAKDSDIYKRAGLDRRHFSKIRSNPDYRPGKNTVIALAVALELDKKGANELLNSAGYSLSDNDTFDLVIQFFLEKKKYDIDDINDALDYFSQKPLAAVLE